MQTIAANTTQIDLEYLGKPLVIASCLLEGEGGTALVDPGPATAVAALRRKLAQRGLSVADLHAILLTHIHLDHCGATGTLVAENPRLLVYVHQRGAPHMIDPTRLLRSATQLYGDDMQRLWGEFLPVPAENVRALAGGERLKLGGRTLAVVYTPGHAYHHVSYLDSATGLAFVGDTAGIRIANRAYVLPFAPPPDIDLERWAASLDEIRARRPERLFHTHFGPAAPVEEQLSEFWERLQRWSDAVRRSLEEDGADAARAMRFAQEVEADLRQRFSEEDASAYMRSSPLELCWYGLARYWRKRATA